MNAVQIILIVMGIAIAVIAKLSDHPFRMYPWYAFCALLGAMAFYQVGHAFHQYFQSLMSL